MKPNALVVSMTDEEQSGCDATPSFIADRKEATARPNGQDGKDKTDDCEQGNGARTASATPSARRAVVFGGCLIAFCPSLIVLVVVVVLVLCHAPDCGN
jgi:hypothetical protein